MDEAEDKVSETRTDYGEQDVWGNSIANLRENLKLSPGQRLRKAERVLKSVLELKRVAKRID